MITDGVYPTSEKFTLEDSISENLRLKFFYLIRYMVKQNEKNHIIIKISCKDIEIVSFWPLAYTTYLRL